MNTLLNRLFLLSLALLLVLAGPLAAGALGLDAYLDQVRAGSDALRSARGQDAATLARLATLHHIPTAAAVDVERGLLRRIEGGCHSPFGALATVAKDGTATLRAATVGTDGIWRTIEVQGPVDTLVERAFALLMAQGPDLPDTSPWYTPARPWH